MWGACVFSCNLHFWQNERDLLRDTAVCVCVCFVIPMYAFVLSLMVFLSLVVVFVVFVCFVNMCNLLLLFVLFLFVVYSSA